VIQQKFHLVNAKVEKQKNHTIKMTEKNAITEVKVVKINDIKGNPNNPRIIKDDKFKKLVESIKAFPEMVNVRPIVVNKDMIVLGGNMRLKAMKEAGWKEAPIQIVDWDEQKQKEFIVKDNVGYGEWDWNDLANNWEAEELIEWGLDIPNFDATVLEAEEDDFAVPDGGTETDIVLGDLFEIGEHRLLCGDSTDSDQVAKLMNGQKADMVYTDPPYGMNLDTDYSKLKGTDKSPNAKGYKWDKVIGDDKEFDFLTCYALFEYVKEQFWWGADYYFNQLPIGGGLFVWQKRDKADSEMIGNDFEICWSKQRHKKATFWKRWVGFDSIEKGDKRVHPTQKPIELASWFIKDWSLENNIIIDLFLGSGTAMVASHQLKRKCYGMELDPKYCQVIVDRMKKLDPTLTIKKNGITI
jgi:DNA modification methylase